MPALRGVSYYRMSTDGQEASIPEQRQWAQRAAPAADVELVREFEDPGIPGSEIESRSDLMKLVAFVEAEHRRKRPLQAVVVWDGDRLSRASSIRTAAVLDRLMEAGVTRILTPEGWTDLENEGDVLLYHIKQDFTRAAFSKGISKNVTRNAAERAAKGWHVAGRVPYGLAVKYIVTRTANGKERRTPTTLEFGDKNEVAAVRWMFTQYATTADSLGDIVRKLTEMGFPPPRPNRRRKGAQAGQPVAEARWKRETVWDMLTRIEYVGDKPWNVDRQGKYHEFVAGDVRRVQSGGKKRWRHGEEKDQVIVRDAHPAIVDRETFEAVQKKLKASRLSKDRQPGRKGDWLLSGVVHCGGCGGRMVGHTQRHKREGKIYTYRRYICRSKFRHGEGECGSCGCEQDVIVQEVAKIIKTAFTDDSRIKELEAEMAELTERSDKAAEKERAALLRRLKQLDKDIPAAARNLLLVSAKNRPDAETALDALKKEREDLGRRLDKVTAAAEDGQQYASAIREAVAELGLIEKTLAQAAPEKVRTLLGRWVEKVTLHFQPPQLLKDGRQRHVLSHVDIDFTPEAIHLLPIAASSRY